MIETTNTPNTEDMPSAEQLLNDPKNRDLRIVDVMIEFAQMHVEAALKKASESYFVDWSTQEIDKEEILNAYPASNIK